MHLITDHKVNGLNEAIEINAADEPGPGGANHRYCIRLVTGRGGPHKYWGAGDPECPKDIKAPNGELHTLKCKNCGLEDPRTPVCFGGGLVSGSVGIDFQNGPIGVTGFNGISNEALLAVLIDRMRGFQHKRHSVSLNPGKDNPFDFSTRGEYACKENACALTHLEEALMWLQKRTRDRMARGVEGTHQK